MVQKTRSRRAKQAHQCAWAATRTKELTSTLNLRIRSRRGATRAVGTVAASILTAAQGKYVLRLVSRLKNLGFAVQIMPMAA
jgi:uncharacterized lipoprotein YmbA